MGGASGCSLNFDLLLWALALFKFSAELQDLYVPSFLLLTDVTRMYTIDDSSNPVPVEQLYLQIVTDYRL